MFALSMIWLVFHYGWSSPLLQIPHSLYSGENLCGKQKFTKICTKREFIDCHIIPFPAIVPHFNIQVSRKNSSGSSLGGQKQDSVGARREEAQERLFLVHLNTSMAWTKQPEAISHLLVCSQLKGKLRIPRWVEKESAQGAVHPSHLAGVLSSSRLLWCLVELAASSALPYIVSATRQILGVPH